MPRTAAWAWLAAIATLALAHQDGENATLLEEGVGGRVKRAGAPELGLADDGRSRRQEPLYIEEPAWVLLDRRETGDPLRQVSAAAVPAELADPFWVARGRRREISSSSASAEEPFWAARGRREMELFWPARGKRHQQEEVPVAAEEAEEEAGVSGQWSAGRERRAGLRDYLASLSASRRAAAGRQYFVPARGKRDGASKRAPGDLGSARRRMTLGSGSAEEPFWAARGRRGEAARLLRLRLASGSSEEPFWAARGRRAGLASASAEEPFWAARGRSLAAQPAFWPARGRRGAANNDNADTAEAEGEDSDNVEDRSFWEKLHEKDQTRTRQ